MRPRAIPVDLSRPLPNFKGIRMDISHKDIEAAAPFVTLASDLDQGRPFPPSDISDL